MEEKEKRGGEESVVDERIVFLFFELICFSLSHTHFFFRLIFRRWSRRIEKHSFFFLPRPSLSLSQPQLVQEVAVPSSSTAQRERRQEKRRESSSFFWKLLLCSRRRRRLVVVASSSSPLFSPPPRAFLFLKRPWAIAKRASLESSKAGRGRREEALRARRLRRQTRAPAARPRLLRRLPLLQALPPPPPPLPLFCTRGATLLSRSAKRSMKVPSRGQAS